MERTFFSFICPPPPPACSTPLPPPECRRGPRSPLQPRHVADVVHGNFCASDGNCRRGRHSFTCRDNQDHSPAKPKNLKTRIAEVPFYFSSSLSAIFKKFLTIASRMFAPVFAVMDRTRAMSCSSSAAAICPPPRPLPHAVRAEVGQALRRRSAALPALNFVSYR